MPFRIHVTIQQILLSRRLFMRMLVQSSERTRKSRKYSVQNVPPASFFSFFWVHRVNPKMKEFASHSRQHKKENCLKLVSLCFSKLLFWKENRTFCVGDLELGRKEGGEGLKNEEKRRGQHHRQHTAGKRQEANCRHRHDENFRPRLKRRAGVRFTTKYCIGWARFTTTYTTSEYCVLTGIASLCLYQHCFCLTQNKSPLTSAHACVCAHMRVCGCARTHHTLSALASNSTVSEYVKCCWFSLPFPFCISPEPVERIALKTRKESIAGTSVSRRI